MTEQLPEQPPARQWPGRLAAAAAAGAGLVIAAIALRDAVGLLRRPRPEPAPGWRRRAAARLRGGGPRR